MIADVQFYVQAMNIICDIICLEVQQKTDNYKT